MVESLHRLGVQLLSMPGALRKKMTEAMHRNPWFTTENQELMIASIAGQYLDGDKLHNFLSGYEMKNEAAKRTGLIMAGNVPLAGFHDLICVWLTGNKAMVKLSSKDEVLLPFILEMLYKIDAGFSNLTTIANRLNDAEAIIATGSNNTARHFEYYFRHLPHIIRKNRSSAAVLTGTESDNDFSLLGKDIFSYFGLGCRNVSKLFVPQGFDPVVLFSKFDNYQSVINHNKYKNNFDYNLTLLLMNKTPHLHNHFFILQEQNELISSPVATIYYEKYHSPGDLETKLRQYENQLQCVVGHQYIPFGMSQYPSLLQFADGADTMKFLLSLS